MTNNKLIEALRQIAREQSATDGAAAADKFQRIAREAIAAYDAETQAEPVVLHELREGLGQIAVQVAEDPAMVRCCRLIDEVLATAAHSPRAGAAAFDFRKHLQRQREWSKRTFGPGARTAGVVDHIRKELREIEADPSDVIEWIDVVILALDGAWRAGYSPEQIIGALIEKQAKNEGRSWPDWRTMPTDKAIEHDRARDTNAPPPALDAEAPTDAAMLRKANLFLVDENRQLKEDAARWEWGVEHARWLRHEHEAYVAIPVDRDSDLSCRALRVSAVDAAMSKRDAQ